MKRAMQLKRPMTKPTNGAASKSPQQVKRSFFLSRFPVLVAVLLCSTAATLAFCNFVLWNQLPTALVGTWTVEGGPQDGATFDFSRDGSLEAHLNNNDMERVLTGTVTVQDRTLFITTQNPHTRRYETRACKIQELTQTTLIVEFDKGEVFKMARWHDEQIAPLRRAP